MERPATRFTMCRDAAAPGRGYDINLEVVPVPRFLLTPYISSRSNFIRPRCVHIYTSFPSSTLFGDCSIRVLSFLFLFTAVQQCPSPTSASRYHIFQLQRPSFSLRFSHWATAISASMATRLAWESMIPISSSAKKRLGQYHK
jgi:hypothetical protein